MRKTLTALTKPTIAVRSAADLPEFSATRTSQLLREILTKNPRVKNFTVQQIVDAIGERRIGTSLMFFSIPGMLPVPGTSNLVGLPASLVAGHMIAGKTEIKLPEFILQRSVPRRSLTVAIHAILPVLERVEKAVKPRHRWASHPATHRALGVLVFLLALVIAFPNAGFNIAHAASIFIISLGMVERDGLAILLGVVAGIASLVLLTGAGVSAEVLRSIAGGWVKKFLKKIGLKWFARTGLKLAARLLKKFGFQWTTLWLLEWAELLLLWNPEASAKSALKLQRKRSTVRRGRKLVRPATRRSHVEGPARSPITKRSANSRQR
jgi:hypothetical protein